MRYFVNTSAAKPVTAGGHTFTFELVGLRGGSWLGILAVDEPAASILAGKISNTISEVAFAQYESLKKNLSANQGNSPAWPRQTSTNPSHAIAEPAALPTSLRGGSKPVDHNSTANITAVSLLTTANHPPAEPLLAAVTKRFRPNAI